MCLPSLLALFYEVVPDFLKLAGRRSTSYSLLAILRVVVHPDRVSLASHTGNASVKIG